MDEVKYFSSDLKVSVRGLLALAAAFTGSLCSTQSICVVIKQQSD